jgi:SulP family sulfate permease
MLIIASLFKFGKIVSFIPTSVITGFTSGIAIIIALGQIDNFFGTTSVGSSALEKLFSYIKLGFPISLPTVFFGALVVVIMVIWPKKWGEYCPSSLAGIIIALICQLFLNLPVHEVGTIPSTLFPKARLSLSAIHLSTLTQLMLPALSIAALGMIESLLCGASAGKMKNEKLNADQELMAQGIGNMLIPLFGGVPATAAIARTSVAIKAGGKTRLVSVFHSVVILISMFLLGSLMSRIPLSALAGVLMVTAWRMNDWHEIKTLFHNKVKTNISQYLITMCATVVFDLTVAIVIGVMVSIILFVLNNSHLHIDIRDIDKDRVGKDLKHHHQKTRIMYLSGPIFFGTQEQMTQVLDEIDDSLEAIIFSMRGVPSIDDSGIHEFFDIVDRLQSNNCKIKFSGVQEEVMAQFKRNHFDEYVGKDSFCWDAIMALEALDKELLIND